MKTQFIVGSILMLAAAPDALADTFAEVAIPGVTPTQIPPSPQLPENRPTIPPLDNRVLQSEVQISVTYDDVIWLTRSDGIVRQGLKNAAALRIAAENQCDMIVYNAAQVKHYNSTQTELVSSWSGNKRGGLTKWPKGYKDMSDYDKSSALSDILDRGAGFLKCYRLTLP